MKIELNEIQSQFKFQMCGLFPELKKRYWGQHLWVKVDKKGEITWLC